MRAAVGSRPQFGGNKYVRRFLIAISLATVTFGLTTVTALADGLGPCCYR
jgi:hypothetical protein